MKSLCIFVIVDKVSETILSVFSAINSDMAKRQYEQSIEANKDKIYDPADIVLMVPEITDAIKGRFIYSVPETYEEVCEQFVSYDEFLKHLEDFKNSKSEV